MFSTVDEQFTKKPILKNHANFAFGYSPSPRFIAYEAHTGKKIRQLSGKNPTTYVIKSDRVSITL